MDNFRQGDLTDIVRASGGGQISSDNCTSASAQPDMIIPTVDDDTWQFPSDPMANIFCSMPMIDHHIHHRDDNNNNKIINNMDTFGDPFSNMRDPLLHELNMLAGGAAYYDTTTPNSSRRDIVIPSTVTSSTNKATDSGGFRSPVAAGANNFLSGSIFDDHNHVKSNIFSRIQISTSSSQSSPNSPVMPQGIKAPVMLPCDMINISSPKGCLLDNNAPVQISSPRNLGIKRRKSQAKKVVCIPAPAAANSRSTGEVVPSDLWAWRKYGQKPIKGSPYPRGYYRCSSSKGCSARKQVERSRTDPNMLVITYTSEHNHPWPTQRNALAGSTRSQPSKGNNISNSSLLKTSTKEEMKESSNDTMSPNNNNTISVCSSSSAATSGFVKEELDKHLEMDDSDDHQIQFSEGGFSQSYRPELPGCEHQQGEDFFADLDEIEPDSLNLLYTHGFGTPDNNNNNINKDTNKSASVGGGGDPFSMFDWSNDDKNTN
ncbi:hypothetical protein ACFE04_003351 [Oxalis oulophora]